MLFIGICRSPPINFWIYLWGFTISSSLLLLPFFFNKVFLVFLVPLNLYTLRNDFLGMVYSIISTFLKLQTTSNSFNYFNSILILISLSLDSFFKFYFYLLTLCNVFQKLFFMFVPYFSYIQIFISSVYCLSIISVCSLLYFIYWRFEFLILTVYIMKNLFKNIFLKTIIISWSQVYTSLSCQCFSNPKMVSFCLFIQIPLIRVHIPLTNCLCWLVRGCQQFRKKRKKKKKKRIVKKICVAIIMIIIDLYWLFYNEISICKKFHDSQRHIYNPVEHLQWRFFGKISTAVLRQEIFATWNFRGFAFDTWNRRN